MTNTEFNELVQEFLGIMERDIPACNTQLEYGKCLNRMREIAAEVYLHSGEEIKIAPMYDEETYARLKEICNEN